MLATLVVAEEKHAVPWHRPQVSFSNEDNYLHSGEAEYKGHKPSRANGGVYNFEYQAEDGTRREESGIGGVSVQGSYAYISPDGTPVHVAYVADHNGFRPIGNVIPEQIQRSYFPSMPVENDYPLPHGGPISQVTHAAHGGPTGHSSFAGHGGKASLSRPTSHGGFKDGFSAHGGGSGGFSGHGGSSTGFSGHNSFASHGSSNEVGSYAPQKHFADSPHITQAILKTQQSSEQNSFESSIPSNHHSSFRDPGIFNRLVTKGFDAIKGWARRGKGEAKSNEKSSEASVEKLAEDDEDSLKSLKRIKRS